MKLKSDNSPHNFAILVVTLLFLLALWLLGACAPQRPPERAGVSSASLVVLMRLRPATPMSALEDGRLRDRYEPSCSAFAVRRGAGVVQLATAAHCVRESRTVRYVPPSGWGLERAHVVYLHEARDVAFLEPENTDGLVPLEIADVPSSGESVRAFSSVYGATSFGQVSKRLAEGWFETTQTIDFGWSGSPVVDAQGHAVGVAAMCPLAGDGCAHGTTFASALAF